jgi:hypothetical protein
MDPLTVTNVNFTLKETVTGTAVAGTVSYSGVSAVFIPLNNLAFSTRYTVTIKGGVSGAKDLAGNALASDYVWSWNTAAAPDTTAPTVSSTAPLANATGVKLNALVAASFSEPMDPLTITPTTFTLACPVGTAITGAVGYPVNGNVATFTPASDLPAGTVCKTTITTGVKDVAGNALASDYVWSWTTVFYTLNFNNAPFTRSRTPMDVTAGNSSASQSINQDGSVTLTINNSPGYADCGFYFYAGTLGNLNSIRIQASNNSGPFSVNLWFDRDNNGEVFAWNGNVYQGVGSDAYIPGPASQNGTTTVNLGSLFTSLIPGGGNYTLAQLKSGEASGINSSTKIALWFGISVGAGSQNATIQFISTN